MVGNGGGKRGTKKPFCPSTSAPTACMAVNALRTASVELKNACSMNAGSGGPKAGWQIVSQNSSRRATRCSGALPAMIAVFNAPIEMPATQFG